MTAALRRHGPLLGTALVLIVLYAAASLLFPGFASLYQFAHLFDDNATLGLAAVGMTFVILSGGIDLSVGAVVALASMGLALLMRDAGWSIIAAVPAVLVMGAALGAGMGTIIHVFRLPPFLVTLAGMFLARGAALLLTAEKRIEMSGHAQIESLSSVLIQNFNLPAMVFLAAVVIAWATLRSTRFGRTVHALGSDETAARLMGLPAASTRIGVYAVSALCAAAGGVVQVIGTGAGDASAALLLELDAIAAVVIGGTVLAGGRGSVLGTLLGVLILAIITLVPSYHGSLNSWWTKIAIGLLLLAFVLLQRLSQRWAGQQT
ncbi:MAG: hypothetical protein IT430_04785 [Phycisphaerales bacterium]|nr:hypothetical protein [Phycisphaerales bacterium]